MESRYVHTGTVFRQDTIKVLLSRSQVGWPLFLELIYSGHILANSVQRDYSADELDDVAFWRACFSCDDSY